MRLSIRDPFGGMLDQVGQLQNEMNRLLGRWNGASRNSWGVRTAGPALNVYEDVENLHVEAELPGLELQDLEIYITGGNQLTLKGERKPFTPDKGVWHRQERGFGSFVRVLNLPFPVNSDKVNAKLENGILTVRLAKHESAKPRKITVKGE